MLDTLNENGYAAYIVGGAVRNTIIGREIHDYDITTSALPDEIERIFSSFTTASVGKSFGTVIVYSDDTAVEVTTHRKESEYSDGRHPDSVIYTDDVQQDLARRDFTMNAIAYSDKTGYVDPFGGISDINKRTVRCVGEPGKRFDEDRLRVLRAVRFSSELGFRLHEDTAYAVHDYANRLDGLAKERISAELCRLLLGENAKQVLTEYSDVIISAIPALERIYNYEQNNPYHVYDLYEHTVNCISYIEPVLHLRLAALFHDIGKPLRKTTDKDGVCHYKGHPAVSEAIAYSVLKGLKLPNKLCNTVCTLIKHHDEKIAPDSIRIKRLMSTLGVDMFFDLLKLQKADILSQNPKYYSRLEALNEVYKQANEILKTSTALNVKDLKINGDDMIALGVPRGKRIGEILNELLELVVSNKLYNDREMLIERAEEIIRKGNENE